MAAGGVGVGAGFAVAFVSLSLALFGVVYCALYSALVGESCEELGDRRWFLQRECR